MYLGLFRPLLMHGHVHMQLKPHAHLVLIAAVKNTVVDLDVLTLRGAYCLCGREETPSQRERGRRGEGRW